MLKKKSYQLSSQQKITSIKHKDSVLNVCLKKYKPNQVISLQLLGLSPFCSLFHVGVTHSGRQNLSEVA